MPLGNMEGIDATGEHGWYRCQCGTCLYATVTLMQFIRSLCLLHAKWSYLRRLRSLLFAVCLVTRVTSIERYYLPVFVGFIPHFMTPAAAANLSRLPVQETC